MAIEVQSVYILVSFSTGALVRVSHDAATRCYTLLHAAASVDITGALVRVSHATATHCNTLKYAATNFSKYNMAEFSNDFRCIL